MGKFTDTKFVNTIDNLVESTKTKLKNPYYIFSDRSPSKVIYYNQNVEKSTLDPASGLYGEHVGKDSPFLFNKINDFIIYGIERISVEYDVGDFGTEANEISGEGIILPNTITPRPGDFFYIPYVKENVLFKVNKVSTDTLDTGANFYKIEYALELTDAIENIEKQVIKTFDFIIDNIGTDFKAILSSTDNELVKKLSSLVEELIIYFNNIFFDSRLQTFVFNHDGYRMYDPFVIEFFIRNRVLSFSDNYIHVSHACATNKTFGMDYMKTLFYALENKSIGNAKVAATAEGITDPNSLFVTRLEEYYAVKYGKSCGYGSRFNTIDPDVLDHIRDNKYYETGEENTFYNLWIAFFNDNKDYLKGDVLTLIKQADYMDNLNSFYALAVTIYIIEEYVKSLLS